MSLLSFFLKYTSLKEIKYCLKLHDTLNRVGFFEPELENTKEYTSITYTQIHWNISNFTLKTDWLWAKYIHNYNKFYGLNKTTHSLHKHWLYKYWLVQCINRRVSRVHEVNKSSEFLQNLKTTHCSLEMLRLRRMFKMSEEGKKHDKRLTENATQQNNW